MRVRVKKLSWWANQRRIEYLYPLAERICSNKLVLKRISVPIDVLPNTRDHTGSNNLREELQL